MLASRVASLSLCSGCTIIEEVIVENVVIIVVGVARCCACHHSHLVCSFTCATSIRGGPRVITEDRISFVGPHEDAVEVLRASASRTYFVSLEYRIPMTGVG